MYFNVLLNRYVEMLVSIKRVTEFLNSPDKDFSYVGILDSGSPNAVEIREGNFEWSEVEKSAQGISEMTEMKLLNAKNGKKPEIFKLSGVNLKIKKGETVFVVGKSNAGKSSFLYTILGETVCTSEYSQDRKVIMRTDKVSIVTQSPFTFMGTFTDNIFMGRNVQETTESELQVAKNEPGGVLSRRKKTTKDENNMRQISAPNNDNELSLEDCLGISCLEDDLKIMPLKLKTPISDTSQTISGGQKTRMSLARALYQQPELLLLDDFLSALDPKVARKVLKQIRALEQRGKSLVISINNLNLVEEGDRVIWLEEGTVAYDGLWKSCPLRSKDLGFNVQVERKKNQDPKKSQIPIAEEGLQK